MADEFVVEFTPQRGGTNFVLHPASRKMLEEIPGSQPAGLSIFIRQKRGEDPESLSLSFVERQIVELLTGLSIDDLLQHVDTIEFHRMPTGHTEHEVTP